MVPFAASLIGITCLVVASWNIPRYQAVIELEQTRQVLQLQLNDHLEERARYLHLGDAFVNDPHYREGMLRRVTRQRIEGEYTLEEWIQKNGSPDI